MNEITVNENINETVSLKSSAFHTIVFGGLAVGILDGSAACISSGLRSGATPDMVFHYVASGLIGRDASYNGGFPTVLLGIFCHFCVAFGAAAGYFALTSIAPAVLKFPFIVGPLYGIFVYFLMGWLIVPLTAAPKLPFVVTGMILQIVIHMICVGSPPAFIAARFAKPVKNA